MLSWKTSAACCLAAVFYCNGAFGSEPTLADAYAEPEPTLAIEVAALPTTPPRGSTSLAANEKEPESSLNGDNYTDESDVCYTLIPTATMCPCTYGWAEGLLLWRDSDATNRPVVINLNTLESLISTGDLDFDAGWGIRAGFGFRRCDSWGWEFVYLGVFDHSAGRSVELADELALPGDLGVSTNNFYFADEVSVHYTSQINNAEINRVCCCCCCDSPCSCQSVEWIYGFRYLNLNEDFEIVSTDFQEGTTTYGVHTNNNLFGWQVGNRARHSHGRWSWESTAKAGIFGNAADQHSDPIVDFLALTVRPGRSESAGNVAFVGDLNLTTIYQINYVWGARLGYNLILIEGVALAPDQLDFSTATTAGSGISTDGGVFLHGLSAGLEARW